MKQNNQNGFSLIELIMVVAIIGIIAAIAVPSLSKSIVAAENSSALSALKIMQLAQSSLYTQKGRFARMDEVNQFQNDRLGTISANTLTKGKYIFEMIPPNPTDSELKTAYVIKATRTIDRFNLPYVVQLDQTGQITQITP